MRKDFLFNIESERLHTLKVVSSVTGISVAEMIRQGVDLFLSTRVSGQGNNFSSGVSVTVIGRTQ